MIKKDDLTQPKINISATNQSLKKLPITKKRVMKQNKTVQKKNS